MSHTPDPTERPDSRDTETAAKLGAADPGSKPDRGGNSSTGRSAEQVAGTLLVAAAERIVPQQTGISAGQQRRSLAERFLSGSQKAGLDLSHAFAVIDRSAGASRAWARQSCLGIPGPGRTAMLFLSSPIGSGRETTDDEADRDACVRAVLASLAESGTVIAQSLPEPRDEWASACMERCGLQCVGDLAYLSRPLSGPHARPRPAFGGKSPRPGPLPAGAELVSAGSMAPDSEDRSRLTRVLERSYEGTLDCPELCGLRNVEDILESHLAAGTQKPSLWRVLVVDGDPVGCCLISMTDDGATAELVYIGLAPEGRGSGFGRYMLQDAIWGLERTDAQRLVCAADRRNTPAVSLYSSLGFVEFSARKAWVWPFARG